jgi:hypothetical protein
MNSSQNVSLSSVCFFGGTTMERDKEHKIGLHYNTFSVYNEFSVAKYKEDSCANENAYDEMV